MTEDSKAVERARRGDESAYAELLGRYRDRVYSFLLRVVGDAGDAEDLLQETFLKVFESLERYDADRPFLSWTFKIAHNCAFDLLRARRVALPIDEDILERPGAESVEDEVSAAVDAAFLDRALAALPPAYREVLLLRHKEELEYSEIARVTGLPEGTVKIRLFRGRELLKGKLEALGLAPERR